MLADADALIAAGSNQYIFYEDRSACARIGPA